MPPVIECAIGVSMADSTGAIKGALWAFLVLAFAWFAWFSRWAHMCCVITYKVLCDGLIAMIGSCLSVYQTYTLVLVGTITYAF